MCGEVADEELWEDAILVTKALHATADPAAIEVLYAQKSLAHYSHSLLEYEQDLSDIQQVFKCAYKNAVSDLPTVENMIPRGLGP